MPVYFGINQLSNNTITEEPDRSYSDSNSELLVYENPPVQFHDEEHPVHKNLPGVSYRKTPDPSAYLEYCSDDMETMLGYRPHELTDGTPRMSFTELIHPDDRKKVINRVKQACNEDRSFYIEYRILTRDKQVKWISDRGKPVFDESGTIKYVEGYFEELPTGERMIRETDDVKHNKYDFLTGLPNRHWFLEKADAAIQSDRNDSLNADTFFLAIIDLDDFQHVNDFFNRDVGDKIIQKMGDILQESFMEKAIIGRVSGDRFAAFIPIDTDVEPEEYISERLEPYHTNHTIDGYTINQEFSVGISTYPTHGDTLEALISSANRALNRIKNGVNKCVGVFEESDLQMLEARVTARDRVERALDENRIEVHYQPVVDSTTNEILMQEALVRMRTESGDLVGINEFKEVIYDEKVTSRLDQWILQNCFADIGDRIGSESFPLLAVNLFPPTIVDSSCFETIAGYLNKYNFPCNKLLVEIPETLMHSHREKATENIIAAADDFGFRFALDDFGVGHGSFKSLNTLPLDFLKIDGTFVQDLPNNPVEQKFVEMTVGLADHMDLEIIGEWIEDQETSKLLKDLGVDFHQGYYYYHPSTLGDWEKTLQTS